MLVLSRKFSERICVQLEDGTKCWITVVDIDRNKVRIGLQFPKGVTILREELVDGPGDPGSAPKAGG